jgi:RHS repeat-associated protein
VGKAGPLSAQLSVASPDGNPIVETQFKTFGAYRGKCGFAPFQNDTTPPTKYRTLTITDLPLGDTNSVSLSSIAWWYGPKCAYPGLFYWQIGTAYENENGLAAADVQKYDIYGFYDNLQHYQFYLGPPPGTGFGLVDYSSQFTSDDVTMKPGFANGCNAGAGGTVTYTPDAVSGNVVMSYTTDCSFSSNSTDNGLVLGQSLTGTDVIDGSTQKHQLNGSAWTPGIRTWVLADLYATAELEQLARGDLDQCGDVAFGQHIRRYTSAGSSMCYTDVETNAATRDLSTDELGIELRRLKFQFKFQSEQDKTYTISYQEKTTYKDGTEPKCALRKLAPIEGDGTLMTTAIQTIEPPSFNGSISVESVTIESKCKCSGGICPNGATLGSIEFSLRLGGAGFDKEAGQLFFHGWRPSAELSQPAALRYSVNPKYAEVIASGGVVQQIKAPEMLVNVVAGGQFKYHLQVFSATNIGSQSGGLYTTNGPAYVTWVIENPDASMTVTNRLRITEVNPTKTITNDYVWTEGTRTWEFTSGNGLRKETKQETWSGGYSLRTETREVRDGANNHLVYSQSGKYQSYTWGEGLIEEKVDPSGLALTTGYGYGTFSGDLGRLTFVTRPDGSWDKYSYSQNKLYYHYSPFLGSGTNDSTYRSVVYCYGTNCVPGAGDDGSLEPNSPRSVVEGYPNKSSYQVIMPGQTRTYLASYNAGWSNPNNLVTTTRYFTSGPYTGKISSIKNPDGTLRLFDYATNSAGTLRTNSVFEGAPNATDTAVTNGTKTVTVVGTAGQMYSRADYDIASGLLTDSEVHTLDDRNRPVRIAYLDGTSTGLSYECCGLSAVTNRDGTVTTYQYDDLKRKTVESVWIDSSHAISLLYQYDANGNVRTITRQGTNGTTLLLKGYAYDGAGRLVFETNAAGAVTAYTYGTPNANGQRTNTTTFAFGTADAATRVEVIYRDGRPMRTTGSAVRPVSYQYSDTTTFETDETALDAAGNATAELHATITDFAGRVVTTRFFHGSGSANISTYFDYNNKGQLWRQRLPASHTLFTNNTAGQLEYSVLDLNQNATIELLGTDRVTRTVSDVVANYGATVRRTRTYVWPSNSVDAALLLRTVETSVDGLRSWDTSLGQTAQTITVVGGNGTRYVTNTAPDGTVTVQTFQNGRLTQRETGNTELGTISAVTYGYDSHGRQATVTDARNGATTYTFDNEDRLTSIRPPAPGGGGNAQTTTNYLDNLGRVWRVGLPDGGSVTNEYYPSGELKKTYGTRAYPVEFLYDSQGRLRTNKTWQGFAAGSGLASTVWNYDGKSGLLTGKVYADGTGPTYQYHTSTTMGLLSQRTWQRGSTTSYSYNNAGEISSITYGGTPTLSSISFTYDRLGRPSTVANGSMTTTLAYNDRGQVVGELYSGGELSGLSVTNNYDALFRCTNAGVWSGSAWLQRTAYTYDRASRLDTLSDGTNSATYAYVANAPLVDSVTFKQSGNTRMVQKRSWDYLNRLTGITASNASAVALVSHGYTYNDANQRTRVDVGGTSSTSPTYWLYQYDSLGQITSGKRYWSDGTRVAGQQFEYTFDDIGNRKTAASGGDAAGANLRSQNYTANTVNQYTQRTVPGYVDVQGSAHSNATVSLWSADGPSALVTAYRKGDYFRGELFFNNSTGLVYAAITNLGVLANGGNPDIVTTNTGNALRVQTPEVFSHDADGNLTNDGRWALSWDTENRLLSMTAPASAPVGARQAMHFGYDYRSRRVSKVVSNWTGSAWSRILYERYVYDGWNLLAALNGTNNAVVKTFCWGSDLSGSEQGAGGVGGLVWMTAAGQSCAFPAYDGNGDVSALVSADNSALVAQCEYGPFGELLRATGPLAKLNPFRFSTKYHDDETDLLYYGYRYLSTATGRWLSRDPFGEESFIVRITKGVSKSLEQRLRVAGLKPLYAAVGNNPLSVIDILGLICCGGDEIEKYKQVLLARYNQGAAYLRSRNVPSGGKEDYSCFNINFNVLLYVQGARAECWTCRLEHRSKYQPIVSGEFPWLYFWGGDTWYDHWAVICKSSDKRQEIMFDYWGNRPAGEDPNTWFRNRFPAMGGYNEATETLDDDFYRKGDPDAKARGNPLNSIPRGAVMMPWPPQG